MSVSGKAEAALREIGLTEYETRAYLFLLRNGAATANSISENTSIPYSKIYEVLNGLEEKGWIRTEAGRPKRYCPNAPTEAFEESRRRFANRMESWRKPVLEELQPLYEKRGTRERSDVWLIRGELDALTRIRDMIDKAESELMIAVPILPKPLVDAVSPLLKRLADKGVNLLVMVSKGQSSSLAGLPKVGEVRVRDNMFGGGIIADGREVLLILGEKKPSLTIWSDHIGLVKFAKDYFEYLWSTAEAVQSNM